MTRLPHQVQCPNLRCSNPKRERKISAEEPIWVFPLSVLCSKWGYDANVGNDTRGSETLWESLGLLETYILELQVVELGCSCLPQE